MISSDKLKSLDKPFFYVLCDSSMEYVNEELNLEHQDIIEEAVNQYYREVLNNTDKNKCVDHKAFYQATAKNNLAPESTIINVIKNHFTAEADNFELDLSLTVNNQRLSKNDYLPNKTLLRAPIVKFSNAIEEPHPPENYIFIAEYGSSHKKILICKSKRDLEIIINIKSIFNRKKSILAQKSSKLSIKQILINSEYYYAIKAKKILANNELKKIIDLLMLPAIIDWTTTLTKNIQQNKIEHYYDSQEFIPLYQQYTKIPLPSILLAINENCSNQLDYYLLFKDQSFIFESQPILMDFFIKIHQQNENSKALKNKDYCVTNLTISTINTYVLTLNNIIYYGFNMYELLEKQKNRTQLSLLFEQESLPLNIDLMYQNTVFFKNDPNKSGNFTTKDFEDYPTKTISISYQIKDCQITTNFLQNIPQEDINIILTRKITINDNGQIKYDLLVNDYNILNIEITHQQTKLTISGHPESIQHHELKVIAVELLYIYQYINENTHNCCSITLTNLSERATLLILKHIKYFKENTDQQFKDITLNIMVENNSNADIYRLSQELNILPVTKQLHHYS
jgi:hypothetical protein